MKLAEGADDKDRCRSYTLPAAARKAAPGRQRAVRRQAAAASLGAYGRGVGGIQQLMRGACLGPPTALVQRTP